MSLVKNQHYVPQSYLRYFADSKERLFVFDKDKDTQYPTNVRKVSSQRFFYDFPIELLPEEIQVQQDKQVVEKFFSDIEGDFKRILDNIRVRFTMSRDPYTITAITPEEKNKLSVLLVYQYMRTKQFRETLLNGQELVMQILTDKIASEIDGFKPGSVTVSRNKDFDSVKHAEFMFNHETVLDFSRIFHDHIWIVGVNQTSLPLFTSDSPLVTFGHHNQGGIASPGIEIDFPITSRLVIMMVERNYFRELALFENSFHPLDDIENIKHLNWLQVSKSNRQVYCKSDDFKIIQDMKLHNPNILTKKRKITAYTNGKKYER